jgi:hypothetical protein
MSKLGKKKLAWEYGYMLGMTAIICILVSLLMKLELPVTFILFLADIAGIVVLWSRPLSRRLLYVLNVLNSLAAASLAYLFVAVLIKSVDDIFAMIVAILVMDVFSFTRPGKHTPNARLVNNNNTLARLCICLPVAGKPGLQPIIGVGDLYFYSAMLSFSLHNFGVNIWGKIFLLILAGQLANIILISIIKNKTWYKGFPATLFPGIFYLIVLCIK